MGSGMGCLMIFEEGRKEVMREEASGVQILDIERA